MSRNPGIGSDWIKKYGVSDVLHRDSLVINGKEMKLPRFYENLMEVEHPREARFNQIRRMVASKSPQQKRNNTDERLFRREICQGAKLKHLRREL